MTATGEAWVGVWRDGSEWRYEWRHAADLNPPVPVSEIAEWSGLRPTGFIHRNGDHWGYQSGSWINHGPPPTDSLAFEHVGRVLSVGGEVWVMGLDGWYPGASPYDPPIPVSEIAEWLLSLLIDKKGNHWVYDTNKGPPPTNFIALEYPGDVLTIGGKVWRNRVFAGFFPNGGEIDSLGWIRYPMLDPPTPGYDIAMWRVFASSGLGTWSTFVDKRGNHWVREGCDDCEHVWHNIGPPPSS